ncbi:MAG: hypothetical protein K1000chlam3_00819 [Chlamydiae bacterium]|nr:hypothetical protein [Chlamydiota bacterium]
MIKVDRFIEHMRGCMKKLLVFCFIALSACAFAQSPTIGQRFYVNPENIHISQHEIAVDVDGCLLPIAMSSVDKHGVYAISDGVHMIFCPVCEEPFDFDNQSSKCPHGWLIRN